MKYLQILNLVMAALGSTLAIVLGVVGLLYVVHLGADPVVAAQLPAVLRFAAAFGALATGAALAWWSQRRLLAWRWLAQTLPLLALSGTWLLIQDLRT